MIVMLKDMLIHEPTDASFMVLYLPWSEKVYNWGIKKEIGSQLGKWLYRVRLYIQIEWNGAHKRLAFLLSRSNNHHVFYYCFINDDSMTELLSLTDLKIPTS